MSRIVTSTSGPGDWAKHLAQRDLHWKKGKSAMSLAACWEAAHPDLPPEVHQALQRSERTELSDLSLVLAIPEFTTPLPGGLTASQTDLMVLARNSKDLVAIGVEGKVEEAFGGNLGKKRQDASEGQSDRLDWLHDQLGLSEPLPDSIRYQLVHRTVAALLFAIEVHATAAVMLVHSFSEKSKWYEDFAAFSEKLGAEPRKDCAFPTSVTTAVPLYLGWVSGDLKFTKVKIPPTG